jgi:hypothetical protein
MIDVIQAAYGDAAVIENGKVRTFKTGATRDTDEGKIDYDGFLSPAALEKFGQYMHKNRVQSDGTLRASDNWQKGIPKAQYMKSLLRHTFAVWRSWRKYGTVGYDDMCGVWFNIQGLIHESIKEDEEF